MPTTLDTRAVEKGSFVITASFTDENGDAVVPKTVKWTLVDAETEDIVNSREQVSATPATSVDILLQGDDLAILHGQRKELRELIVEWTYDGSLGNDIPQKDMARFYVTNPGWGVGRPCPIHCR